MHEWTRERDCRRQNRNLVESYFEELILERASRNTPKLSWAETITLQSTQDPVLVFALKQNYWEFNRMLKI